jgi:hypothetical protein
VIQNFDDLKKQLSELSTVLNGFKSEAVQLRLVELIFEKGTTTWDGKIDPPADIKTNKKTPARKSKPHKTTAEAAPGKKKRVASGSGANATLSQLLDSDFFTTPRTINDIIQHCKHNMARTFKANEFSSKLGRMVRNNELTRKKNAEKQYEYKKL